MCRCMQRGARRVDARTPLRLRLMRWSQVLSQIISVTGLRIYFYAALHTCSHVVNTGNSLREGPAHTHKHTHSPSVSFVLFMLQCEGRSAFVTQLSSTNVVTDKAF